AGDARSTAATRHDAATAGDTAMMRWLSRLSPRERAIVVGGTAILAVVLLWLFVITPLRDRTTATADLVPERERLLVRRMDLLARAVEIAVSAEIRQLVDLLARVEGAQKLLTVKDLRVRVVNVSQPKELLATLTVSGFILPPGKAKT